MTKSHKKTHNPKGGTKTQPAASWENCDPDGAQTEGGVFHYLDTQPFREGTVEAGSGGTRVVEPNGMNLSSPIPH
jgi:hypothetical protein